MVSHVAAVTIDRHVETGSLDNHVGSGSFDNHVTTLEPSLAVLSLEKPQEATPNDTSLQEEWVNNTNGSE